MSEINAIATNNYLLATQQEVSHDNTLSGNGTVDSPLGVVPGYNETVLFETDSLSGVSAVTCSESVKNFERIAVLPSRYVANLGGGTGPYQFYETKWLVSGDSTVNAIEPMIYEYLFWKISKYSANADFTQFVWNGGFEVEQDTLTYRNATTCNVGIKKIVGINRKA